MKKINKILFIIDIIIDMHCCKIKFYRNLSAALRTKNRFSS